MTYYESVAARMAGPGAGGPATTSIVTGRAPEGSRPAGLVGATVDTVVEFLAYDPATGVATFKTPEGVTERSWSTPPCAGSRPPAGRASGSRCSSPAPWRPQSSRPAAEPTKEGTAFRT